MESFFTSKEVRTLGRPDNKTYSCVSCGLYKQCKSPKMRPFGNFKKGIMNIGEAPGEIEDINGKPFQGPTGVRLRRMYKHLGIDLFDDCINLNAANCRPEDNATPSNYELACCRQIVVRYIQHYKPKVIVLLGNSALFSVIGGRWKKNLGGITKWRGWSIPDQDFNTWIVPTFHPSHIDRENSADVTAIWKRDLEQVIELANTPFVKYKEPVIDIIDDLSVLRKIKNNIALDYETTGLKPHKEGHRIICVSIADTQDHAYVFMLPPTKAERQPLVELLSNPNIKKIAQNMKFEHTWSAVRLRTEVKNWAWDTMLATHIMDNRPAVTGLKFQTYVQFGVIDYDSEISPYIKAIDNKDANAINRIEELINKPGGAKSLMYYCALDSIYTYRLAMLQQSQILLPF